MVRIQIRDYLKAAVEGNDLPLDMFLQYPTRVAYNPPQVRVSTCTDVRFSYVDTHANNRIPTS